MWNRLTAALTASVLLGACAASGPQLRSPVTGLLAPCEASACVNSQMSDKRHAIEPMRYTGSAIAAREKLTRVLKRMESQGYQVVTSEGDYVHATHTGGVMKSVDHLEFVFSQAERGVIHIRAGAREHLEAVRVAFNVAKS